MDQLQIILTHEHADAVLGLDDIRAVQPFSPTNDITPTPIYLTQHSLDRYGIFTRDIIIYFLLTSIVPLNAFASHVTLMFPLPLFKFSLLVAFRHCI